MLEDIQARNCSNIVYTKRLPWRHNKRHSDGPMQRCLAMTLGLRLLMRSSWSVAMAPVWVACRRWSALLFNKYFEDPLGEHNTLSSHWVWVCDFTALHCLLLLKYKLRELIIWSSVRLNMLSNLHVPSWSFTGDRDANLVFKKNK